MKFEIGDTVFLKDCPFPLIVEEMVDDTETWYLLKNPFAREFHVARWSESHNALVYCDERGS